MAIYTFKINPSADIHLVVNDPVFLSDDQKRLHLEVIGFDSAGTPSNITSSCIYSIANNGIASVSINGRLTPKKEGITFLSVEHRATKLRLVARVWVHKSIMKFYIGNNSGTVNVGKDNFQPTIYGEFNDDDYEDVSGHPYFEYSSNDTSIATVNTIDGRVSGVALGTTKIVIKNKATKATIGTIPIDVENDFSVDRPIVERVTFKGYGAEKRNILFLAEGFTQAEENKFKRIVKEIDKSMRENPAHEPFKMLTNDYNTWLAFKPSVESGISVGPPIYTPPTPLIPGYQIAFKDERDKQGNYSLQELINLVGFPTAKQRDTPYTKEDADKEWTTISGYNSANLSDGMFEIWKNVQWGVRLKARNSAYGLIYAKRLGDRYAEVDDTSSIRLDNHWYTQNTGPRDFIFKDPRRTGSSFYSGERMFYNDNAQMLKYNWKSEFFNYLKSLKIKGLASTDPYYNIGDKWNIDGDDQGLVMVIVNDELFAANYHLPPNVFGCVAIGVALDVLHYNSIVSSASNIYDHNPSTTNTGKFLTQIVIATAVHELCHGLFLGDEYENIRGDTLNTLPDPNPETLKYELTTLENDLFKGAEVNHNLNSMWAIDRWGSKWSISLFRTEKSSALISDALKKDKKDKKIVTVNLFPNEGKKWKNDEKIYLSSKNRNVVPNEEMLNYYPKHSRHMPKDLGPYKIIKIETDTLTLEWAGILSAPEIEVGDFPKRSMIMMKKELNNNDLTIILPGVLAYLNGNSGTHSNGNLNIIKCFSKKTNCTEPNLDKPITPTPNIPNVSIDRNKRNNLLGMHEGGGSYNCGIVRATAICKMRSEYDKDKRIIFRLCHLCKYIIVQEFNPSKHSELDKQYPGTQK